MRKGGKWCIYVYTCICISRGRVGEICANIYMHHVLRGLIGDHGRRLRSTRSSTEHAHSQRSYVGGPRGTHSDSLASKTASLCSRLPLKMATPQHTSPEGGDMEARTSLMIEEAIERHLGSIVNRLSPRVTQQQTGPQPTGGESLLPPLSHSLSRPHSVGG